MLAVHRTSGELALCYKYLIFKINFLILQARRRGMNLVKHG
jgi:hypothetical protein